MRWLSLTGVIGTIGVGLYCLWLLLLAYRVVGKPVGQDPRYDAWIAHRSAAFKIAGVLGILSVAFQIISRVARW
jgi:hypothetical protein